MIVENSVSLPLLKYLQMQKKRLESHVNTQKGTQFKSTYILRNFVSCVLASVILQIITFRGI
jgi:hypothetical protein